MISGKLHFIAPKDRSEWYKHGRFLNGEFLGNKVIWEVCFDSWKDSNFEIELINDTEDINNVLKENLDEDTINILLQLPKIYSIDLAKYLILGTRGGGYSDMDVELMTDFSHIINPSKIYINSRGKLLQNSLIFSGKNDFWLEVVNHSLSKIKNNLEGLLEVSKQYDRKPSEFKNYKEKLFLKSKHAKSVSNYVGAEMLMEFIQSKKLGKTLVVFPEKFFNRSFENPFAYTRHYCTGYWKLPEKQFNNEK